MSQSKYIFGFGSLINKQSLLSTAADATDIRPCYVKGFRRDFSVWASEGWTTTNLDYAGIPFCALDIQKCEGSKAKVNGVCFTVDEADFKRLTERECEYKTIEVPVYDYETDEELGTYITFSCCKNSGEYAPNSAAQVRYLEICAEGARSFGEKFYKEFLDTTYIGNQRLSDLPELTKELAS